ncbi:solute carrier family 22 member 6-B-like [Xenentodon cancila]
MKFDSILSEINGFGRFQMTLFLLQAFSRITLPCHFLLNNFMAAVPSHHCNIRNLEDGGVFGNLSVPQKLAAGIPAEQDGTLSSCRMFTKPKFQYLSGSNSSEEADTVTCENGWVYDNSTFKSTLATEWDLVCSRKGMNKATATVFFVGVMIGALLFGFLSDRFGRRPVLLVSYLSSLTFAVLSAFSTSYVMFIIMRLFTGLSLAGISIISIALNVEWCCIERRTFAAVIISLDWTLGNWLLVGLAYCVNEWRMLILAVTSPLILAICTWRWLPESARWLMANRKLDAAHHYIVKCAKMNDRSKYITTITPTALLESSKDETGDKKYTITDLFRTPNMRKLAICSGIVWFGVAFTYYGISLNIMGFGLNPYLTQFIFASIEMPMKIGIYFSLEKLGRRYCEMGALLSTGLCLFINIFVPKDKWLLRTIVAVLGKSMSEVSFTIIYLYTTEFYPTVVRQNGLGYTSFLARLGVSISPLVVLLEDVWHPLPESTYCAVAVCSGLVASLLPETLNTRLPELIEDIENPRTTMRFENVLADINGFGRFQMMIVGISFLGRFTMPCHFMLNNFVAAIPAHHCDFSSLNDGDIFMNLSHAQRVAVSIPVQQDGSLSSCQMFAEPQYHLLLNSSRTADVATMPCQNGWVYDNKTFISTVTSQWDLVCERRGKNKATATIFFVGVMFGAMTFGSLSDRYGRKTMLLVSYVSGMLFAIASAFSTTYVMFAVLRFFTGFCITGIIIVSTVLSVEWVDIEHRKMVGVIDSLSWTFGNTALSAIAYFVTDWRWLIVSVTSPLTLAIISWRWMPESARWLIANGKLSQAQVYLKKCAKMNRTEESTHILKTETLSTIVVTVKRDRTFSYLDLIRTPKMRKLALRTGLLWFCVATTFYGISFNITGFGLNIYLTQFTYALIEVPAKVSVYYLLDKIGRRSTEAGSLLLVCICLGINVVIPKHMSVARTVVAVIGKGFSSASFATLVLYSSELYPTVVRQNGMGYNSFMARFGVAVAPLILLLDDIWRELPQVVLCCVAAVGALVARSLSETRDRCLPETIEDVEQTQQ